jgi:hypothetical protein
VLFLQQDFPNCSTIFQNRAGELEFAGLSWIVPRALACDTIYDKKI